MGSATTPLRLLLLAEEGELPTEAVASLSLRYQLTRARAGEVLPDVPFAGRVASCASLRALGAEEPQRLAPPLVVAASRPSVNDVIAAMRARAVNVADADDAAALLAAVDAAIARTRVEEVMARFEASLPVPELLPEMLGESAAMSRLRQRIERVASADISVLVLGPTGSGKELAARALHGAGRRRGGPFVALSCGAIPRHLADSELFGHTRGAFTGAVRDRTGVLVQASGGTLFLDDVADLSPEVQAKLLRVLQEREVRPLGHAREVSFDARIVAASSRDLEREVAAGRFRQDLYFRLNGISLQIPPLSERGDDVLLLALHFLWQGCAESRPIRGFTAAAARALLAHDWPGNVRELAHTVAAAHAAARFDRIGEGDLPLKLRRSEQRAPEHRLESLHAIEKAHILATLRATRGNRALAARLLKLDRKTLYRKLRSYELPSSDLIEPV